MGHSSAAARPYSGAALNHQGQPKREESVIGRWDGFVRRRARYGALRAGLGSSPGVVDDLAQEARVRLLLLERSRRVHGDAYVKKTIINAIWNAARGERRHVAQELNMDGVASESRHDIRDPFVRAKVSHWLKRLSPGLRRVYQYIYVDGLDQRSAAAVAGVSQPRIAALHRRLLERARRELGTLR